MAELAGVMVGKLIFSLDLMGTNGYPSEANLVLFVPNLIPY